MTNLPIWALVPILLVLGACSGQAAGSYFEREPLNPSLERALAIAACSTGDPVGIL